MGILSKIVRRFQRRLRGAVGISPHADSTLIGIVAPWGVIDTIDIDPSGLIRIFGWSYENWERLQPPKVQVGGTAVGLHKCYRMQRPDVPRSPERRFNMLGFVFEYLLPEAAYHQREQTICLGVDGQPLRFIEPNCRFVQPHYHRLFAIPQVLGRDDIYGSGPPNPEPSAEVLELVAATTGSVLDFGCGAGALVAALRGRGREAHGIELDRDAIRSALGPQIAPHVTVRRAFSNAVRRQKLRRRRLVRGPGAYSGI